MPDSGRLERPRLEVAIVELMAEQGYEALTEDAIEELAGVSKGCLARELGSIEEAVLTTYWRHTDDFTALLFAAYEAEASWREGFRAAAYAAARWIRDNPAIVRFGTVRMFAAGLAAQAQRESHLHQMVDLIDAGRQELDDPSSVGRGVAEGIFGAIYELLVREVQKGGGTGSAPDFVPELMYIAVRPYLGQAAAREELTMPPPPEPLGESGAHEQPRYGQAVSKAGTPGDEGALRLARLPPGRHGLPREYVTKNQRDRLTAGTISVVAAHGLNDATITQICAAAGVSRRTFYGYFSSKEECFFDAYDTIVEHLKSAADEAAASSSGWPDSVAAKVGATLEFFALNPDLAKFCLVVPQRAGADVASRYRAAMDRAVAYLCEGMPEKTVKVPSDAVAVSLIGGMVALVVRKVEAGEGESLPELLPDLVELFLTPYLGRGHAVEVAEKTLGKRSTST